MTLHIYQDQKQILISESILKFKSFSLVATIPRTFLKAYLQSINHIALILVNTESLYNDLEPIIFSFANHGFVDK